MISKRYVGYALFAVLVICWLLEIENRNDQFPQIDNLKVEEVAGKSHVNFRINNPNEESMRVATHIRLLLDGQEGPKRESSASPVTVLTHEIEPQSEITIEHLISNYAGWKQADVKLYVLDNAILLQQEHLDRLSTVTVDRLQELFK